MQSDLFLGRTGFFFSMDHGGDSVSGGGHPANVSPPATDAIEDAFDLGTRGRGQNAANIGVPGSKGLPVGKLAEDIRQRAQEIWEEEGRPEGRAPDHWLRAEAEIAQRGS